MGKIQNGKLLYHLTKLENLDSIIENGLASRRILIENNVIFDDVADPNIMDKRTEFGLDSFIPFHFHPYSSFDVAVKNGHPEDEFIYICVQRSVARENQFLILPKHPLSIDEVELLEYDEGLCAIDWEAMEQSSTTSDYIRTVRMAECLTDKLIPVDCFHSIAVRSDRIKRLVERKVSHISPRPFVDVQVWLNR